MVGGLDKNHCIVLKDGKFDTDNGTDANDLKHIFNTIGHNDAPVLLHFHGGLTNKQAGVNGANQLRPVYDGAGVYPIFFVWESGWEDVLNNNLPTIFKEPVFQKILARVTQFAKGKVDKGNRTGTPKAPGGVAVPKESAVRAELNKPADGREPFSHMDPRTIPEGDDLTTDELKQFKDALQADPAFDLAVQQVTAGLTPAGPVPRGATVRGSTATLMDPDALNQLTVTQKGARSVSVAIMIGRCALLLVQIIKRFAQRRDHGFYPTIVEELFRAFYIGNAGRFLWDGMKQDIVDSFGVGQDCGGTLFLTELEKLWKSGKRRRLTLVGHSAGAIYACRFLQEVQSRDLPPDVHFNVIFIAPACDFNLLAKTIQSAGNRIDGLRVFGMGDALERKDAIASVIYPSSLLYFVSGVIEKEDDCPLVGMQRYYGAPYNDPSTFVDIDYAKKYSLFRKDSALVWSMAATASGFSCDMTSHGGWASTNATVDSVVHIIKNGYDYAAVT